MKLIGIAIVIVAWVLIHVLAHVGQVFQRIIEGGVK